MDTNESAGQASHKVATALHHATDTGRELAEKARGTARDAGAAADLYLHEYAWTSAVLIAAIAGFVGYLLGTRRR